MESARHPFPVSSTALHYRRIKSESQGKLGAIGAVQNLRPQSFASSFLVLSEVAGTISSSSASRSEAAETKPMRRPDSESGLRRSVYPVHSHTVKGTSAFGPPRRQKVSA